MKTELFSISKIFTERLLRIPDYQRGYAWTDKQLKEYWSDITQLELGQNHYVGVLTLEDASLAAKETWEDDLWIIESKSYEPHYIVDGQQRLTTTIILIQCIVEFADGRELNYTTTEEIRKKFIYESKDGGISRSYLFGYVVDNPSYEYLKQKIFCEPSDNHNSVEQTIYTNNLLYAKNFFTEKLGEMEFEDIELLYKKVTQNLLFNIYSMSDEIDVHVSFETMNNRGKPLSHLELLKNRLIYLSTKFDTDEHERSKLRKAINDCWKTIYHQLGRNKENPLDDDEFLLNHFILFFGEAIPKEMLRDLRYRSGRTNYQQYLLDEKFTVKSIYDTGDKCLTLNEMYSYVSSMKQSVERWYEIYNPNHSRLSNDVIFWLEKVNRIDGKVSYPLVLVALQREPKDEVLTRFFVALERLLFLDVFSRRSYYLGLSVSFFIELAKDLSTGESDIEKTIKQMDELKNAFMKEKTVLLEISNAIKEGGFYKWRGLKYFLYEYELQLLRDSKSFTEKISWESFNIDHRDAHTIEHVYPQNPRKLDWTSLYSKYSSKQRSTLRHTLGNLVPLSKPKNSSFQNKPFLEKVGNNKNTIGFKYGSFSEIEIANNSEWTALEILNRSIKLLRFLEKRWDIKFESIEAMVDFLRLDFVIQKENVRYSSTKKKFVRI
ncbi:TPA: DUF262 domain-containing protein [Vibrio parahaemolyticus]|jgi:uncharacterized protein with ParB-like and HNH nuclease domain|nr:DUF262 domain-containing protein [Vibrio parahaemolyticus]HCG5942318.1 DUF262 domain-containing protein [Vibrio parahaemolyticus]